MSSEQPQRQDVTFEAVWNVSPFNVPTIVNQFMVSEGAGTMFGPDGVMYMTLGHVAPLAGQFETTPDGRLQLPVNVVGQFAFTIERAQELVHVLQQVIVNSQLTPGGRKINGAEDGV